MLIAFVLVVLINLSYYFFVFRRLGEYEFTPTKSDNLPPVSIVICAHDEVKTLNRNLPSILEQKYPEYEVIVVNDNSEDDSEMMLMLLEGKYPHLVVRHIHNQSKTLRGKKYPLTIGIRAAKYDHILLTDADCTPPSNYWIREMASMFSTEKEIVLGYAPYKNHPGFLNKFIRYEAFISALQYFSFALARVPYMGVGRNLAYRKQIFFDHNIYPKHPQLLSGDDDLLINAAATKFNTAIQVSNSSFMFSEPKQSWDEYWHQKKRHVSTSRYYKSQHKFLLSLFAASNAAFYFLGAGCFLYTNLWVEALMLFVLRVFIQGIVFRTTMRKLGEQDLLRVFPMMDILFLLYYVKLLPAVFKKNKDSWK